LVAIQKTWQRIRQKARIPNVRIHDLRHSFASFAINNGGLDLIELQKLLGHKDIKTTTRYIHLTNKKLLGATNRIFSSQQ
jgi:integrase